MALQIDCPWCGRRSVAEFTHGDVPDPPTGLDPAALAIDRRFFRTNPEGPTAERWFHSFGCRRWLTLHRDRAGP